MNAIPNDQDLLNASTPTPVQAPPKDAPPPPIEWVKIPSRPVPTPPTAPNIAADTRLAHSMH